MATEEAMTYEEMFRHTQAAYGRLELRLAEVKRAHAAAEAERIALADAFRRYLESVGMHATTAALMVQDIIDNARTAASSRTGPPTED